jgi:hypothetical protein
VEISDIQEIAQHRLMRIGTVRDAQACVDPDIARWGDYYEPASLRLVVDSEGHVTPVSLFGAPECRVRIAAMVSLWRYRPFQRGGRAVTAHITERIAFAPPERWRVPRRVLTQFAPQFADVTAMRIVLERWAGLSTCGLQTVVGYRLELDGDGTVQFDGTKLGATWDGPRSEIHERSTIDTAEFARLITRFWDADFCSLEDEYISGVTDSPSYTLTLESGATCVSVRNNVGRSVGAPDILDSLADEVDRVAGSSRWVGVECERVFRPY